MLVNGDKKKRGLFACAFIFLSDEVTESLHFLVADGCVCAFLFILRLIPREADEVAWIAYAGFLQIDIRHDCHDVESHPSDSTPHVGVPASEAPHQALRLHEVDAVEEVRPADSFLAHEYLVIVEGVQEFFGSSSFFSSLALSCSSLGT